MKQKQTEKKALNILSSLISQQMKPNPVRVYQAQNDSSDLRYFITSEKNLTNLVKCTAMEKISLHSLNRVFLHKHSNPSALQLFQWQFAQNKAYKFFWTTVWPKPKIKIIPPTPKYAYR